MDTALADFDTITREERPQAKRIAEYLLRALSPNAFPPKQRVLDVGCGPGLYTEELRRIGFDAIGVDNDSRTPEATYFRRLDVTASLCADPPYDAALSLEVGEHIPDVNSGAYCAFLASAAPHVLYFSAARPGQGGSGHINCQNKLYWTRALHTAGFFFDPEETEAWLTFMRQGPHMGWLTQNGMVFRRERR